MPTEMTTTMQLRWVKDEDPRWDADRQRVFGTVPVGVFAAEARQAGDRLPSDWWRVQDGDRVVGFGWLDDVWGDAEILLAVEESARGTGAGAFALARLEDEAAARGLNYVVNVVRDTHPDRDAVTAWFTRRGFTGTEDGRLRKQVGGRRRDAGQEQDGRPGARPAPLPDEGRQQRYAAERERATARSRTAAGTAPGDTGSDLGPGHEESGGYVDQERHQY
jgi:N-acetylglutamate synthase-like GNAT family acetyltransferase